MDVIDERHNPCLSALRNNNIQQTVVTRAGLQLVP